VAKLQTSIARGIGDHALITSLDEGCWSMGWRESESEDGFQGRESNFRFLIVDF
jgi:hypothetical protein